MVGVQQASTGSLAGVSSSQGPRGKCLLWDPTGRSTGGSVLKWGGLGHLCFWMPPQQCGKWPRVGAQPYHNTSYNLWSILQLKSLIQWLILHRASLKSSVMSQACYRFGEGSGEVEATSEPRASTLHRKLWSPGLLNFRVEGRDHCTLLSPVSWGLSDVTFYKHPADAKKTKFKWLQSAWRTCLYLFLDSGKTGERRGSTGVSANICFSLWNDSYDSQRGIVITFLECINNKTTPVISLKMYKKALAFRKVNVQVSFPLEVNTNSEEQEKIGKNEPGYCKSVGSLSCNSRHCCKSWNIKISPGGEMDADWGQPRGK